MADDNFPRMTSALIKYSKLSRDLLKGWIELIRYKRGVVCKQRFTVEINLKKIFQQASERDRKMLFFFLINFGAETLFIYYYVLRFSYLNTEVRAARIDL